LYFKLLTIILINLLASSLISWLSKTFSIIIIPNKKWLSFFCLQSQIKTKTSKLWGSFQNVCIAYLHGH
jgi:hypothetical protein